MLFAITLIPLDFELSSISLMKNFKVSSYKLFSYWSEAPSTTAPAIPQAKPVPNDLSTFGLKVCLAVHLLPL